MCGDTQVLARLQLDIPGAPVAAVARSPLPGLTHHPTQSQHPRSFVTHFKLWTIRCVHTDIP